MRKSWCAAKPGTTGSDSLVNNIWWLSPSTILQIYKQCVESVFEYGSLLTITTSDTIISKIQRFQNKFIWLALRLPEYISVKLLHDSSGLPYVKDRLLSCATRTLERISNNCLVEVSTTFNSVNPAWDHLPINTAFYNPSGQSLDYYDLQGQLLLTTSCSWNRKYSPYTDSLGTIFGLRIEKPTRTTQLVCLSWDAPCVSQAIGSLRGHPSIWSISLTLNLIPILKKN